MTDKEYIDLIMRMVKEIKDTKKLKRIFDFVHHIYIAYRTGK